MNILHLIYALEVLNCGTISKAAQNLFVAQPNLSSSIKELEQEIGIIIFNRSSRGITVTKDGEEFLKHAREIVLRFSALEQMYSKHDSRIVRISVTTMRSSIICAKMTRFINNLITTQSAMKIHFKEATNFDAINDVANNQADIGIIRANNNNFEYFRHLAESKQCNLQPLPSDKYTILMSKQHPLADQDELTAEMLKPYTEVVHGDFETPWYPYSESFKNENVHRPNSKLLFIYDRGSLMDVIRMVNGAYTWTTSTDSSVLKMHGLIEKHGKDSIMESKEAIVYRYCTPLTDHLQSLIDHLSGSKE